MNPPTAGGVSRSMLTLVLSNHHVNALAFSPDSARLAVACGRKLALLDWQAPGELAWYQPSHFSGHPTSLAFMPDGSGVLIGHGNLKGHGDRSIYEFNVATGQLDGHCPERVSWPIVVAGSDPPAALAVGSVDPSGARYVLVVPLGAGPTAARLGELLPSGTLWDMPVSYGPKAAWVVRQNQLLVWSEGFLRWFRWPPPPAPPPGRWRALASALTGSRPAPPELEVIAEYPFPFVADAIAPLPDGDTVLAASKGVLTRWHAPTATELARWRYPGMQALRSLAVSPDGTVAAVGGNVGRVVVWDLDV